MAESIPTRVFVLEKLFQQTQEMIKEKTIADQNSLADIHTEVKTLVGKMDSFVEVSESSLESLERTIKEFTHEYYVPRGEINDLIDKKLSASGNRNLTLASLIMTGAIALSMGVTYLVTQPKVGANNHLLTTLPKAL